MPEGTFSYLLTRLTEHKERLHLTTVFLYFVPITFLTFMVVWLASPSVAWPIVPLGLLLAGIGSLVVLTLWRIREASLQVEMFYSSPQETTQEEPSVSETQSPENSEQETKILQFQQSLEACHREHQHYLQEIEKKSELIKRFEQEKALLHHTLENTHEKYKKELAPLIDQVQQQKVLLEEYQCVITQQRQDLSKQEQTIASLENRIRDLTYQLRDQKYEIETLLQLTDLNHEKTGSSDEPPAWLEEPLFSNPLENPQEEFIASSGEASLILKRCVNAARSINSPNYYSLSHSPFGQPLPASHTLDFRRLCDSLRNERGGIVLLFSPKEDKVLFVNSTVKTLTGWSTDKFTHDFFEILAEESQEWRQAVKRASLQGETQLILNLKTKDNPVLKLHASLSTIPTGLFRSHVIAVLFPNKRLS